MENEAASPIQTAPKAPEGVLGWVESIIVTVSQITVGQTFLKLVDGFLWVVEKTAQWSLPCSEIASEENGKTFGKMELVRPLPWILFLPSLVILRAVRGGLNVGAFVLGYPQIQPSGVVKFVQKSRRRLRALNLKATKNLRRRAHSPKDKRLSMIEAKKALIRSIRLTLSTLSCLDNTKSSPSPPPTKIHISGIDLATTATPEEKSTTESTGSPAHTEAKRKYSEISTDESEDEPLLAKLERSAMDDSAEDLDFNPADCSSNSSSDTEDEEEEDVDVSLSELEHIKQEAGMFLNQTGPFETADVTGNSEMLSAERSNAQTEADAVQKTVSLSSEDSVKFHTPLKLSQDGDMTYYSPISSKSSSPEPSTIPSTERELYRTQQKTIDFMNGEVNYNSATAQTSTSKEELTSEKRSSSAPKQQQQHKGKRSNHENRKKKQ